MQKNGKLMALSSVLPMAALGVFVMAGTSPVAADCQFSPSNCCNGATGYYSLGACIFEGCYIFKKRRCEAPQTVPGDAWWSSCRDYCVSPGS